MGNQVESIQVTPSKEYIKQRDLERLEIARNYLRQIHLNPNDVDFNHYLNSAIIQIELAWSARNDIE